MLDYSKTLKPQASVIIPYHSNGKRLSHLNGVLAWVSTMNIQIIVVEQDTQSRIKTLDFPFEHIFVKSSYVFNRSLCINVGVRQALADKIFICDADTLLPTQEFVKAYTELDYFDCVKPYNQIKPISIDESFMHVDQITQMLNHPQDKRPSYPIDISKFGAGIVMFKRDMFIKMGGYDEQIQGWGLEDQLMAYKILKFSDYRSLEGTLYHIQHEPTEVDQTLYNANQRYVQDFINLTTPEQFHHVVVMQSKHGNKASHTF
jgi:predicted glycosyltransferase involved in capsule biosynthesis